MEEDVLADMVGVLTTDTEDVDMDTDTEDVDMDTEDVDMDTEDVDMDTEDVEDMDGMVVEIDVVEIDAAETIGTLGKHL
jgi:hypothetical protein